ncbi:MAG: hypothetical protein IAE67_06300 [Candidatus Competibacteraceae bacterium]|nr:hypothetical protein [Candidatus Competibacteraceae bacterium]
MKKYIFGFLLSGVILFGTGCLGSTEDYLQTGTWKRYNMSTYMHDIEFNFNANGTVIFKNITASVVDTGTYQAIAGGEHNFLELLGMPSVTGQIPNSYDGKWTIIRMSESAFAISIHKEGYGVLYHEFINI